MLKLKVIYNTGTEEICYIPDFSKVHDEFAEKVRLGIIKDYEVLG